jgi:hypothetical protein
MSRVGWRHVLGDLLVGPGGTVLSLQVNRDQLRRPRGYRPRVPSSEPGPLPSSSIPFRISTKLIAVILAFHLHYRAASLDQHHDGQFAALTLALTGSRSNWCAIAFTHFPALGILYVIVSVALCFVTF